MNKFSKYQIHTVTGSLCLLLVGTLTIQFLLTRISQFQHESAPTPGRVAGTYVGGVVESTPTNTLYEQLKLQEQALREQTSALEAEKRYLENKDRNRNVALYTIIILLSLLVVINFYLDIKRNKLEKDRLNLAS